MGARTLEATEFVDTFIDMQRRDAVFRPLSGVLAKNRAILVKEAAQILGRQGKSRSANTDQARSLLLRFAVEGLKIEFKVDHFVLFKQQETVEVILEDAFELETEQTDVLFPFQEAAAGIVVKCLFPKAGKSIYREDVFTFLLFFWGGGAKSELDEDKVTRYKTMVWFAFLLIGLVTRDRENACREGVGYIRARLLLLLKKAADEKIICEETESRAADFEGGKWTWSLFGLLQGKDRKPFLERLRRQFNFENRVEHANRALLDEHRECMYRQTLAQLC
jgi:hypothetical protein